MNWPAPLEHVSVTGVPQYDLLLTPRPEQAPSGPVQLSAGGSKHAGLYILIAALTAADQAPITLRNVPRITDVDFVLDHARHGGAALDRVGDAITVRRGPRDFVSSQVLTRSTRVSVLQLGSALARFGAVDVQDSFGGCRLGNRPVDQHIAVLSQLGAEFRQGGGRITGRLPPDAVGGDPAVASFSKVSTMGTINALLAAAFGSGGRARIRGIHARPEILHFADFLTALGSRVEITGDIADVTRGPISRAPVEFPVMDDLDHALGLASLAFSLRRSADVLFRNPYRYPELDTLREITAGAVYRDGDYVRVRPGSAPVRTGPVDLVTGPYPALNSDSQPILASVASWTSDKVRVTDLRFEDRFRYADQLRQVGRTVEVGSSRMLVRRPPGRCQPESEPVVSDCPDLRSAFAALLIAFLAGRPAELRRAAVLGRGYPGLVADARALGAKVARSPVQPAVYVAGAVVVGDKILLQQRTQRAGIRNPGKVSLFGGRALAGEDPPAALLRELREELRLRSCTHAPLGEYALTEQDEGIDLRCLVYMVHPPDEWEPRLMEGDSIIWHGLRDPGVSLDLTALTETVLRDIQAQLRRRAVPAAPAGASPPGPRARRAPGR
jgi:UDP-N-acetylglucosamine 1-carboxyvinyltransferase